MGKKKKNQTFPVEVANTMAADLRGRLRNTPLPYTNALMPLFEAVVNSIHAIEEAGMDMSDGSITVAIQRQPKEPELEFDGARKRGPDPLEDIVGFTITDNGIGFNGTNMLSFQTLDSQHKVNLGGRGIGRLLWLKAFDRVTIDSVFKGDGDVWQRRSFDFTATRGIHNEVPLHTATAHPHQTQVRLQQFSPRYRQHAGKRAQSIADKLLEHCLWYFIREGGAPKIIVADGADRIDLDLVFDEHMHSGAVGDRFNLKGHEFDLVHVKLTTNSSATHTIGLCADKRLVIEEKISGKIPGLYGRITHPEGDFVYSCYVSSKFLDECARPERTGFDIAEDSAEGFFEDQDLSLKEIRNAVLQKTEEHLKEYLTGNLAKARERVEHFVRDKAPRYRPILGRIPTDRLNIDPAVNDKDLDMTLHKHWYQLERDLIAEGHEVMDDLEHEFSDEYQKRLDEYLAKAQELKQSDLASYVSHRRVIIDLFEKATERKKDGKYAREDLLHSLIIKMRTESTELKTEPNLWLIDERLAFHDYLASDRPISSMPITASVSGREPDIAVLNVFDEPLLLSEGKKLPPASLVIVEIKRPMRDDAGPGDKDDPIEQALDYLTKIRNGEVTTHSGRPIPQSDSIPGFCYILADLTASFKHRCRVHHDMKPTADGMGFFSYKDNLKAYVEVISFDRLVKSAKERNKAFFAQLGLPSN